MPSVSFSTLCCLGTACNEQLVADVQRHHGLRFASENKAHAATFRALTEGLDEAHLSTFAKHSFAAATDATVHDGKYGP
jgi:hypothetical protein